MFIELAKACKFSLMTADCRLERLIESDFIELQVADFQFQENIIMMQTLLNPFIDLCFLQRHNVRFDIRQGIVMFPYHNVSITFLSMQLRPKHTTNTRAATPLSIKTPKRFNLEILL